MATRRHRMDAARDKRYSWALAPLTLPAVIRYRAARVVTPVQRAGRYTNASYRRLASGVAAIVMMLAALAESRWLTRIRRAPAQGATKPGTASNENRSAAASLSSQSQAPPVKATTTPSGMRVVDKRKAGIRPAAADFRGAGAAAEGPTQPRPANQAQQQSRWRRAVIRVSDAVWFPMLGRLILAGRRTPLPVASDLDVGRYAWRRTACRYLLRDKPGRAEYLSELIDLAADETAGDWRSPVVWWVKRHVRPADLARFVQDELVRPGRAALADRRLILLLRLAGHAAAALPDGDARAVIRTALACARKQVDPYAANGLTLVSRSVVTVLLEQRPELDEIVTSTLELQAGESQMPPDRPLPVEARLLAIATRDRAPDFGSALSRAAVKAGFGPAQMEAAARLADAPLARPPRLYEAERIPAPLAAVMFVMGRGLPWLTPVVVAASVGAVTHHLQWAPAHTMISLGDSIALLALLAAVNVFTVQLSASRLPGVIARSAGQPWELFFSYSAALMLLGLSVFRAHAAWLVAATSWAALAALVLYSAGLPLAMFRLLRRTDAGRAAGGYVARTLPMARVAGRRLGRIQARAAEMREALETVPAVRMSPDAFAGEWSRNIAARARGFFLPSRAGMRRLLADGMFGGGMRLRVFAGLGTIVGNGEDTAALIPARDQTIPQSLARRARRTLRTRSCSRVEDVATGAIALTQMALDLANAGDIGTSRTVTQNVVRLVAQHTAAARRARTQMFRRQELRARAAAGGLRGAAQAAQASARARDTSIVPVVPALRDSLRVAVQGRLESRKDLFNVPGTVLEQLLSSSGQAEAAVSMVTFSVPAEADKSTAGSSVAAELLRIAGVRALELRDSTAFEQVLDQLARHSSNGAETWEATEVTGLLAATACRFDVRLAQRAIERALAQIAVGPAGDASAAALAAWRRLIVLWRAGAAGLACGAMSVAVHAANKLFEFHGQDALDAMASDRGRIAWEAARSNLRNGYLGDQPEDALTNFGTFLKDIGPVLKHPGEGEVTRADSS
jgi:hypothetical protein